LTRHELKEQIQHDHFRDAVSGAVNYAASNREQVVRLTIAGACIVAIVALVWWYQAHQRSVRQQDLEAAFAIAEAPVGTAPAGQQSYPTKDAKQQAEMKAFSKVVAKDGNSREGLMARYYLGTLKGDRGDSKGAEADLRAVADSRSECAALAKIALAQLYTGENRVKEAQTILRGVIDKPADLVSKTQAQILLAQLEETTNPKDARKILQSLRAPGRGSAASRAADQILGEMSR